MGAVMCGVLWRPYPEADWRRCDSTVGHGRVHHDPRYLGRQASWTVDSGGIHDPGARATPAPDPASVVYTPPTFHDDMADCGVFVAGTQQRCVLPEHHQGRHALPVETCPVTSSSGTVCAHYVGHDGAHGYTR